MMSELKPCPFCGGKAVLFKTKKITNGTDEAKSEKRDHWAIGCETWECILHADEEIKNARLFFRPDSKQVAIDRWNRRAKGEQQ